MNKTKSELVLEYFDSKSGDVDKINKDAAENFELSIITVRALRQEYNAINLMKISFTRSKKKELENSKKYEQKYKGRKRTFFIFDDSKLFDK
ncbi:MAG: hypothetical protein RR620_13195 [Clostridium sp.]